MTPGPDSELRAPPGKRRTVALVGLAVLAVALHLGTINNELTYDDHAAIEQNPNTDRPLDLWAHLTSGFWGPGYEVRDAAWRPATTLTFAWNRAVHGISPGGYHLVNLLLHALATVLIALLARELGLRAEHAIAAAALFAVHPLHVEAIASGVGRADLLMSALGLAAVWTWLRGRVGLALALLAVALLAKEMAVAIAPVLVWHDFARAGVARSPGWRWRWLLPLVVVGAWLAARYAVLGTVSGATPTRLENPLVVATTGTTLLTAGALYAHALQLFVAPVTLLADYSFATLLPTTGASLGALVGWALLLATAGATLASFRRAPGLSIMLALWLGPYLLVSHLGPTLPMFFAERVLYLPSAGLCLFVGWLLARAAAHPTAYRICAAVLLCALVAFAARSHVRVDDWRDDATLHARTTRDAPNNIKSLGNTAVQAAAAGEMDDAVAAIERALALDDEISTSHLIAASLYIQLRRPVDAKRHIDRAAELDPDLARMAATRCAYAASFAPEHAIAACTAAIEAPFAGADAWMFLAIAYDRNRDPDAADAAFQRAIARDPNPRVVLVYNYGIFLARNGRYAEARPLLQRAAELAPHRDDIAAALERVTRSLQNAPR